MGINILPTCWHTHFRLCFRLLPLYLRDADVLADVLRQVDHISVLRQRHDEAGQRLQVKTIHGVLVLLVSGREEVAQPQEAEQDPQDARLVQVVGDPPGQRQHVGQLVEHLRLLAAPLSGRVPRSELPLLGAAPAAGREDTHSLFFHWMLVSSFRISFIRRVCARRRKGGCVYSLT